MKLKRRIAAGVLALLMLSGSLGTLAHAEGESDGGEATVAAEPAAEDIPAPAPEPASVVPGVGIDGDTPLTDESELDGGNGRDGYTLEVNVISDAAGSVTIDEDDSPLGMLDVTENCCALHLVLMLLALCVSVYYTHDRKKHQANEFELRRELGAL